MRALYLAIDQGGHASRALLYDRHGHLHDTALVPVGTRRSADGLQVEHDPEALITSLRAAIDMVCSPLAGHPGRIVAAGLATQRSSMVCWDRSTGAALSPVLSWQDRRHAAWLARFEDRQAWIHTRTGLVLSPHYGASKMRWCLDHLPVVAAAARAGTLVMGPLASFILCRLLIERPLVVDPANASRTLLWDPRRGDWSDALLELFGIARDHLPRCVHSRHACGTLDTAAGPVPLGVCTGDQSAAPFAFGPLDPALAYINTGTGAFIQRSLPDRPPDAPRLLTSVVWSDSGHTDFMLEGTVNGAGSAIEAWAAAEGCDAARALDELAAHEPPGEPPLYLNGISGLGSPYWLAAFDSRYLGSGGTLLRLLAVLESIVFLVRVNLDEMQPHSPPLAHAVLTGGLSANRLFCQRLANLCRLPVWRSDEREATARGLAWLVAGSPAGWPRDPGEYFQPRPDAALDARFGRWHEAMMTAARSGAPLAPRAD